MIGPQPTLQAELGLVSRETLDRLSTYQTLLSTWGRRINLVGSSTLNDSWRRHFLDSAQLTRLAPTEPRWLDIGSGAGLPGMVVAIMLADRKTAWTVDLVESNRKKAVFLQLVASELDLSGVRVHAARFEEIRLSLHPDVVTARAVAPLRDLLGLVKGSLQRGAKGLFHKGRHYLQEIHEADSVWQFDMLIHPNRVLPDGVILEVSNLRPRPAAG